MSKQTAVTTTSSEDKPIVYRADGVEIKLSIGIVRNQLTKPTRSGAVPGDQDVIKYMMLCKTQKLNPWASDAFLVGYDGKNGPEFSLIQSHASLLKKAEANPQYDGLESGVIVKRGDDLIELTGAFKDDKDILMGGWCKVHRKDRRIPAYRRIKLAAFDKNRSLWLDMKEGMITKCAEAAGLREAFPNSITGYIHEEMGLRDAGNAAVPTVRTPNIQSEPQKVEGESRIIPPKPKPAPGPEDEPTPNPQTDAPDEAEVPEDEP
ncbi:MAG: phage recombination protein Bet, partial [Gammaproteobacteria bacterium]|nr:phage recombination protein Bet [Gammaproteobacteria bacterium]